MYCYPLTRHIKENLHEAAILKYKNSCVGVSRSSKSLDITMIIKGKHLYPSLTTTTTHVKNVWISPRFPIWKGALQSLKDLVLTFASQNEFRRDWNFLPPFRAMPVCVYFTNSTISRALDSAQWLTLGIIRLTSILPRISCNNIHSFVTCLHYKAIVSLVMNCNQAQYKTKYL